MGFLCLSYNPDYIRSNNGVPHSRNPKQRLILYSFHIWFHCLPSSNIQLYREINRIFVGLFAVGSFKTRNTKVTLRKTPSLEPQRNLL